MEIDRFKSNFTSGNDVHDNVTVTIDEKKFEMRQVTIVKRAPGKITLALQWKNHLFTDFYAARNGKFSRITIPLKKETLLLNNIEVKFTTMAIIGMEAGMI